MTSECAGKFVGECRQLERTAMLVLGERVFREVAVYAVADEERERFAVVPEFSGVLPATAVVRWMGTPYRGTLGFVPRRDGERCAVYVFRIQGR